MCIYVYVCESYSDPFKKVMIYFALKSHELANNTTILIITGCINSIKNYHSYLKYRTEFILAKKLESNLV